MFDFRSFCVNFADDHWSIGFTEWENRIEPLCDRKAHRGAAEGSRSSSKLQETSLRSIEEVRGFWKTRQGQELLQTSAHRRQERGAKEGEGCYAEVAGEEDGPREGEEAEEHQIAGEETGGDEEVKE